MDLGAGARDACSLEATKCFVNGVVAFFVAMMVFEQVCKVDDGENVDESVHGIGASHYLESLVS